MDPSDRATLTAVLLRVRPWCLRAAALLRLAAVAVAVPTLMRGGVGALLLALFAAACAMGLWRRMIWPWRLALAGDVVLLIVGAVILLQSEDLALFGYIAGGVTLDVILLSVGQAALDPGVTMPPTP